MPGFIALIGGGYATPAFENEKKILDVSCFTGKDYMVERRTNRKFMNDKVVIDDDRLFLLLEGVVVNNWDLVRKHKANGWQDCVRLMYESHGDVFYKEFRGTFCGCIYNKSQDKWTFFTDHIGDKQILYAKLPQGLVVATEINYVAETLKHNGCSLSLDMEGAYMALTLGYVIENKTLFSEIHKVPAGHYLQYDGQKLQEVQCHRFSFRPVDISVEDAVEEIDTRFRESVKLNFEKDKEYGYKHMATLSGGMDSRMTVWVSHDLGYQKQLNLTFSQSNYLDFSIAQEIATDLHHDFVFKALDNGNCIYDIDKVTPVTGGSACFFGVSHTKSLFDLLNYEAYGLVHTGELGDVILGSYVHDLDGSSEISIKAGAYSIEMMDRLKEYQFKYDYDSPEMYMMYNRGFGFVGQGTLGYDHTKTETLSPFCNVDFMEFCFGIPLVLRCNHKIYFDWVLRKYPQAADYIYEGWGGKIRPIDNVDKTKYMTVFGNKVPHFTDPSFGNYLKGFVLRRLGLREKFNKPTTSQTFKLSTKQNMNPVDYWYNNNQELRSFMDGYWYENKDLIQDEQLKKDMRFLYEDCEAVYDKLQTLSLLSAIKAYL